jgi:NAD(P)-dependent dehydrogenase (short-subunit alcohol dehydrogenase family)
MPSVADRAAIVTGASTGIGLAVARMLGEEGHAEDASSRRFALRRTTQRLEFYDVKHTGIVESKHEFHGHPATWVPTRILRILRARGDAQKIP